MASYQRLESLLRKRKEDVEGQILMIGIKPRQRIRLFRGEMVETQYRERNTGHHHLRHPRQVEAVEVTLIVEAVGVEAVEGAGIEEEESRRGLIRRRIRGRIESGVEAERKKMLSKRTLRVISTG